MKNIKFRLLKNRYLVGYEVHKHPEGRVSYGVWHSSSGLNNTLRWVPSGDPECFIEHDSKDIFTGMYDIHSTEIYENDAVKVKGNIWKVLYSEAFCSFMIAMTEKLTDSVYEVNEMAFLGDHKKIEVVTDLNEEIKRVDVSLMRFPGSRRSECMFDVLWRPFLWFRRLLP